MNNPTEKQVALLKHLDFVNVLTHAEFVKRDPRLPDLQALVAAKLARTWPDEAGTRAEITMRGEEFLALMKKTA